jgi:hypothetical protein
VGRIEVVPDQADNDDEITVPCDWSWKGSPADETEIRAARGTGSSRSRLVPNDRTPEMAEMDAWPVFGVDGVVNRLELRHAPPAARARRANHLI